MGGPGSGRFPEKTQPLSKAAEARFREFRRFFDQTEETEIDDATVRKWPRIKRVWLSLFREAVSEKNTSMKAAEQILTGYLGKPVQQVEMDIHNRTPEERAASLIEALETLEKAGDGGDSSSIM